MGTQEHDALGCKETVVASCAILQEAQGGESSTREWAGRRWLRMTALRVCWPTNPEALQMQQQRRMLTARPPLHDAMPEQIQGNRCRSRWKKNSNGVDTMLNLGALSSTVYC